MKTKPSRQVQRARSRAGLSTTPQRQRGAAAVFAAVALIAMIISMLLAINVGRLYYAKRDLQKQATMAALAGASLASGCRNSGVPTSDTSNGSALWNAVHAAISANNGGNDSAATTVMTGVRGAPAIQVGGVNSASGAPVLDDKGNSYPVAADGLQHFIALPTGDSHIQAVRVNLSAPAPSLFGASFFPTATSAPLYASATAKQDAIGSFYLGTELASLSGGLLNSLLGGLLCAPGDTACQSKILALDLLSSTSGLANVNVSLGQLATALGVSVQDLSNPLALSTKTPIASDVLNGLANALSGTVSGTVSGLLRNLAAASTNPNGIPLGNLLQGIDTVAGNVPFVDLSDLILALGEAATADPTGAVKPIALPVSVKIPGISTVDVFVSILAPPVFAAGHAGQVQASTAQITLKARIQVTALDTVTQVLNGVLSVLSLLISIPVNIGPVNLGIDVAVDPATAWLDSLQCPTLGPPVRTSPIAGLSAKTSVATVSIGTFTGDISTGPALAQVKAPITTVTLGPAKVLLGLINLGSINLAVNVAGPVSVRVGGGPRASNPPYPVTQFVQQSTSPPTYLANGAPNAPLASPLTENPQTINSQDLLSSTISSLFGTLKLTVDTDTSKDSGLLGALGGLVSTLTNTLVSTLTSLLGPLLTGVGGLVDALLDPLLQLLGITVGNATITMNGVSIGSPVVVTTALPGTPES